MNFRGLKDKIVEFGRLLKLAAIEWWNDDTFRLAASLAFYTIFSLAPILLIAVGIASIFISRDVAADRIIAQVQQLAGPKGADAVRQVIAASSNLGDSIWAIILGVVTLFLGASAIFAELQTALNKIWDVAAKSERGILVRLIIDRLRSFSIALGVGFLLLVSLVLTAALSGFHDYFSNWMPGLPWLWETLNIVISLGIITVLFAMIYKYLPDAEITWGNVWIGAFVTSILFTAGKSLIGYYLGRTAAASAFGAAGSFVVLLLWFYYSAIISFFGAEFTQVFARRHGTRIRPEAHAERVGKKSDRPPGES